MAAVSLREIDGLGRARPACGRPVRKRRCGLRARIVARRGLQVAAVELPQEVELAALSLVGDPPGGCRSRIGSRPERNRVALVGRPA